MGKKELESNYEHILIIDDEEPICNLTAEMLSRYKYTSICLSTFKSAIDYYKENFDKVDLIIMDYTIPGESPEESITQFKKINPDVKIMVISGYLANDIKNVTKQLEISSAMQKPFDMDDLINEVKRLLG